MQIHDFDWFRTDHSVLRRFGERAHEIHGKTWTEPAWMETGRWLEDSRLRGLDELVRLDRACTETVGRGGGKQGT